MTTPSIQPNILQRLLGQGNQPTTETKPPVKMTPRFLRQRMFHLMCQNSLASFYSQSDRFVTEHQKGTELSLVYMTEKKIPKL